MLEEIIRELTAIKNDDCIMSGGVLEGAKRVEAQKAQTVALNMLTKSRQFDKIKLSKKVKEDKDEPIQDMDIRVDTIQSIAEIPKCMSILQIQQTTAQDEHLQCL